MSLRTTSRANIEIDLSRQGIDSASSISSNTCVRMSTKDANDVVLVGSSTAISKQILNGLEATFAIDLILYNVTPLSLTITNGKINSTYEGMSIKKIEIFNYKRVYTWILCCQRNNQMKETKFWNEFGRTIERNYEFD